MSQHRESPVEAPGRTGEPPREAPRHEPPLEDAPAERDSTDTDAPERDREPVPGVTHEPEPDAGNIMPAEDEPGTF